MAVAFINASLDPRITVYRSYMYVSREVSKRVPYRLRGKQWSVIQRTSKYVTVTLETVEESINANCINDYLQLEVKGGSFNAT